MRSPPWQRRRELKDSHTQRTLHTPRPNDESRRWLSGFVQLFTVPSEYYLEAHASRGLDTYSREEKEEGWRWWWQWWWLPDYDERGVHVGLGRYVFKSSAWSTQSAVALGFNFYDQQRVRVRSRFSFNPSPPFAFGHEQKTMTTAMEDSRAISQNIWIPTQNVNIHSRWNNKRGHWTTLPPH